MIEMGKFTIDEAKSLIQYRAGKTHVNDKAEEVIKLLDYHPLGISIAAAQVAIGDVNWDELNYALNSHESLSILEFDNPQRREDSLRITIDMSIKTLSETDLERFLSLGILSIGSKFSPEEIINVSPDIRVKYPVSNNKGFSNPITETMQFDIFATIRSLARKSLINFYSDDQEMIIEIHPVVHEFLYEKLTNSDIFDDVFLYFHMYCSLTLLQYTVSPIVINEFYEIEDQWELALDRIWIIISSPELEHPIGTDIAKPAFYSMIPVLLKWWSNKGNSEKIYKWASIGLKFHDENPAEKPDFKISMLEGLHSAYIFEEKFTEAKKILEQLEEEYDDQGSSDNARLDLSMTRAGHYLQSGDFETSIRLYLLALEIANSSEDFSSEEGIIYGNLGNAYLMQEDLDKAEFYFQLAIKNAEDNQDLIAFGQRTGSLGTVYLKKGTFFFRAAEEKLENSFRLLSGTKNRESLGKKSINLGVLNYALGKPNLGKAYLSEAINIFQKMHHPMVYSAQKLLDIYEGKSPPVPEFFDFHQLTVLTQSALLGDEISKQRVIPTLEFYSSHHKDMELSQYASVLNQIIHGTSPNENALNNLPEELRYNAETLLRITSDKGLLEFSIFLGNTVRGIVVGDEKTIEGMNSFIEKHDPDIKIYKYFSQDIREAVKMVLDGEKETEVIVSNVNDQFFKNIFTNAISFALDKDIHD